MKVFVTGASGWIGSAVVPRLLRAGHEVTGLARSDASAAALEKAGAAVVRGELDDLNALRAGAEAAEGVIHLAYRHDISLTGGFEQAAESDRAAISTFGDVLAGSDRPLVIASGLAGLPTGVVATERDTVPLDHPLRARADAEAALLALAEKGVRSSSIRLAPTVHGDGDHGFVPTIISVVRQRGVAAYVGDGSNHWPAVHRDDAADLFVLAAEKAPAGTVLHGVAEQGVRLGDVAAVIGKQLNLPVESITAEQSAEQFGFIGHLLATDMLASSDLTQELLGWKPAGPTLLEDLEAGHYFR
jgi:nucleoside-diphosphate-sugar epimerase